MKTLRRLTTDRDEKNPACFGFALPSQSPFPITTVFLPSFVKSGQQVVAQADIRRLVIYQLHKQTCNVALEDLYVAHLRTAETLSELRRKVENFGTLAANWDDEGAESISGETVNTALQAVEHIAIVLERKNTLSAPSVQPFPDGSIFFKWIRGQKELAITIHGRNVEAQHWEPLDTFHSQGLWEIPVDAVSEHVEWVLI